MKTKQPKYEVVDTLMEKHYNDEFNLKVIRLCIDDYPCLQIQLNRKDTGDQTRYITITPAMATSLIRGLQRGYADIQTYLIESEKQK